jgi:hypothetical protein
MRTATIFAITVALLSCGSEDLDASVADSANAEGTDLAVTGVPELGDELPFTVHDTDYESPPQEPEIGTILTVDVTCGLIDGVGQKTFEYAGDELWDRIAGEGVMYDDLKICTVPDADKWLEWDFSSSSAMMLVTAGLEHDLQPTDDPDRWFGEVTPIDARSQECLDALDTHGLSFPIHMSLSVIDVAAPAAE